MGRSRILPNGVQLRTVLALHIRPVVSELDAPINDRLGYFSLTFPHAACSALLLDRSSCWEAPCGTAGGGRIAAGLAELMGTLAGFSRLPSSTALR